MISLIEMAGWRYLAFLFFSPAEWLIRELPGNIQVVACCGKIEHEMSSLFFFYEILSHYFYSVLDNNS